jgi:hypothetical protein
VFIDKIKYQRITGFLLQTKKSFGILIIFFFFLKKKKELFILLSLEQLEPGIWRSPHQFWPSVASKLHQFWPEKRSFKISE